MIAYVLLGLLIAAGVAAFVWGCIPPKSAGDGTEETHG